MTFTGFLPGPTPSRYVVRATVQMDPSDGTMNGPYRTEVLDPAGNPLFGWTGTVRAWRQAVQGY